MRQLRYDVRGEGEIFVLAQSNPDLRFESLISTRKEAKNVVLIM